MRWPDLFFKSRKPKTPAEITGLSPSAPDSSESSQSRNEPKQDEKTASLRALGEMDTVPLPSVSKDPGPAVPSAASPTDGRKPVAVGEDGKDKILPAGKSSFRRRANLKDVARIVPEQSAPMHGAAEVDVKAETSSASHDPIAPTPVTDSGGAPAATSNDQAKSPEPSAEKFAPAAVIPAAFPVAAEAGRMMEKEEKTAPEVTEQTSSPEKIAVESLPSEKPAEAKPQEHSFSSRDMPVFETEAAQPASTGPDAEQTKASMDLRERREFILANGERILGHVLSETAQTIYLDHQTLGVLTLARSQIAKKPIEVILINGDRIVGDLIAETPECLYIRHASLGMLTVPHNQRSTRVVEAILKDGDRILGEVLAETENFTVIRSASLGTVAVQHQQMAMLNRKIEQLELRLLPAPPSPAADNPPA